MGQCFGGIEVIGIAAGESENPSRDVPRAISGIVVGVGGPLGGARETAAQEPVLTYQAPFYPWGSLAAGLALVAVMVTMAFLPTERVGLVSGGAAVGVISLAYAAYLLRRVLTARAGRRPPGPKPAPRAGRPAPRPAYGLDIAAFMGLEPEDVDASSSTYRKD